MPNGLHIHKDILNKFETIPVVCFLLELYSNSNMRVHTVRSRCLTPVLSGAVRRPAAGAGRSAPESGVEQCPSSAEAQPRLGILFNRLHK